MFIKPSVKKNIRPIKILPTTFTTYRVLHKIKIKLNNESAFIEGKVKIVKHFPFALTVPPNNDHRSFIMFLKCI